MAWYKRKQPTVSAPAINTGLSESDRQQLMLNALSDVRARIAAAVSGGYDFADTLHDIYLDFGYPASLDFFNLWNMYRRFGIAQNVVDLPVEMSWMRPPTIESETDQQFNREIEKLIEQVSLFQRLKGLDTRQRVGRYAGMFMRVRDNLTPDRPIEGKLPGLGALMQMVPLYEGQLEVLEIDDDPTSERYTLPETYQFKGSGAGSRNEKSAASFVVHHSRVVPAAEGADNGGIYGIPALESCYNSLLDLRKIIGGGAEGFYKNAAQSIIFDLKDASSAKSNAEILKKFNEHYDDFARNRSRRAIWTPGMDAKALNSELITPKDFFNNALNDVSASSKIPATLIIGQQTGRLASQEDSRGFLSNINSRNENFVSEMTGDVIDWCMEWGILPIAEYTIEWDDLLSLSDAERLEHGEKMSVINEAQFKSGGEVPFSGDEIRLASGFEEREEEEPGGEELDDLDE